MKLTFIILMSMAVIGCAPKTTKQVQTPVDMSQTIVLPQPSESGATLLEALKNRASEREYSSDKLSMEQLGGVLWAASGINRPENGRQTAPSALALYPVRVYAFFEDGTYLYDPASHSLQRVLSGDNRKLTGMQDFVFSAPLDLLYVADLSVFEPKGIPADKGRVLAGLDAAGYAQNVNLYCAAENMASITRGSYPEQQALAALSLDQSRFAVVLAQTVGLKKQ